MSEHLIKPPHWRQQAISSLPGNLDSARLELAKRYCRRGNPFPLIAQLWPHLVISDPEEAKWFEPKEAKLWTPSGQKCEKTGYPLAIPPEDPSDEAWLSPCLRLDSWQRDLIQSVFSLAPNPGERGEVMTKGCTKAGKGASTAIAICLWWYVYDPCKIIITGPNYQHVVTRSMLPEVKNWLRLALDVRDTVVQAEGLTWKSDSRKVLSVANPDSDEGFSGAHSEYTLIVLDESSKIRSSLFVQAVTQAKIIVALSNPRAGSTWFRRCFNSADPDKTQTLDIPGARRRLITVGAPDCVNVKAGKQLIPAQVTRDVFESIMAQEPEWPGWNECMGLGKFPKEDTELQFFAPSWFERHEKHWQATHAGSEKPMPLGFGLDVGASESGDPSCWVAANVGGACGLFHQRKIPNVLAVADWFISGVFEAFKIDLTRVPLPVVVDMKGVGFGTGNKLMERGVNVIRAEVHENKSLYQTWRAEKVGELSRRLDPLGAWPDIPWGIPPDPELRQELLAHERGFDIAGRVKASPKEVKGGAKSNMETVKSKIGRSPNKADALFYAYFSIASLDKQRIPTIKRDILVATQADCDQLDQDKGIDPHTGKKLKHVRLEDLPTPKPVNKDLEDIAALVKRTVLQMNAEDDERLW